MNIVSADKVIHLFFTSQQKLALNS